MSDRPYFPAIDLVLLTRDESALNPQVAQGIESQRGVRVTVHRIVGEQSTAGERRWSVIARARNEGKRRGVNPWLFFLDDDVVLDPDCLQRLLKGLRARPAYAALAADYLSESHGKMCSPHVAMGATLFRRVALDQISFRFAPDRCECSCCASDLRQRGMGIGYLPEAQAKHISLGSSCRLVINQPDRSNLPVAPSAAGNREAPRSYILTAFDRLHYRHFHDRFVSSLRAAGNMETILALAYGLYPSQRRKLDRLPGVWLIPLPPNRQEVALCRLLDFQQALGRLPKQSIVAYWDAGDVIFQDRLGELWSFVRANPNRLLVVGEPQQHPQNRAVAKWTLSISDPQKRRRAFDLLSSRPYFNGGFAAATAETMICYLQKAHQLRHSIDLLGTLDWGDQTALNLYCHTDPNRYMNISDDWNYCLCGRRPGDFRLLPEGRFVRSNGRTIPVVHGNARTFNRFALLAPAALARAAHSSSVLI
jgi:hypothetical protein